MLIFSALMSFLLIVLTAVVVINRVYARSAKDGSWHPHGIARVRRWTAEGWEYRKMSEKEHGADLEERTW
jgi:hypothetical protein